jgi:hypothetical protein
MAELRVGGAGQNYTGNRTLLSPKGEKSYSSTAVFGTDAKNVALYRSKTVLFGRRKYPQTNAETA